MKSNRSMIFARLGVVAFVIALIAPLAASAANITSGSLLLGDPRPDQTTSYTFSGDGFTTGTAIECIQLVFSVGADGSGGVPSGMTTTGSALSGSSTLITPGSWTVGNGSNGTLQATYTTGENPSASGNIIWTGVENGDTADTTYYGTFTTYANDDCTGAVDSTVIAFIYKDGALVSLTVEPMLAFTVSGVAASQLVNGATTTLESTATAIDFSNDVTASVKGVSAHDVMVETNGTGFAVYLRQSGNFTNGSFTITPWTGTNENPTSFPAAGTLAWGYTTADSTLGGTGAANRFTSPANGWAGMQTTNELVMDGTTLGDQTTRVGHQLGISASTPAGNYTTTLIYTAAGTY